MARASSAGSAASISVNPSKAAAICVPRFSTNARQASVVGAGRSVSLNNSSRMPAGFAPGHNFTSSRVSPIRISNCFMPNCGWPSSAPAQLFSSSVVSSAGRTTAPCGSVAMTPSNPAVAGMLPVEPAAITGACGGCAARRCANARSAAFLCAARSSAPSSARISGQCVTRSERNSRASAQCSANPSGVSDCNAESATPSVCISSRNPARLRANAAARTKAISWPVLLRSHCAIRVASNRTRRTGAIGGARAKSSPCGSNRKSSSSTLPSGRISGSKAAPPSCAAKASLRVRTARRVGT